MTGDIVLECRAVSREFLVSGGLFAVKKRLAAVNDVDLAVRRGEVLAIVGESGCGKTTLARMMLGLLPPTRGAILVEGRPLESVGRIDIARRIQPVFQDPYSSLNPRKTLASVISLPLHIHRIGSREERHQQVDRLMELVGLPRQLLYVYPSQLSGGQRQRVAIARALAMQPEILVCDEPTSALDVSVQAQILNLLQALKRELGLTLVIVSHNLAVVEHMADRMAVMYLGRVVEAGRAREVLKRPRHPYTRALLEAALTPDPGRGLPELHLGPGFPDPLAPPPGCTFHPRCPQAMRQCAATRPARSNDDDAFVECHLYADEEGAVSEGRSRASSTESPREQRTVLPLSSRSDIHWQ